MFLSRLLCCSNRTSAPSLIDVSVFWHVLQMSCAACLSCIVVLVPVYGCAQVNGVNLENVAHEQAVSTLKNVSDVAVMFLRPSVSVLVAITCRVSKLLGLRLDAIRFGPVVAKQRHIHAFMLSNCAFLTLATEGNSGQRLQEYLTHACCSLLTRLEMLLLTCCHGMQKAMFLVTCIVKSLNSVLAVYRFRRCLRWAKPVQFSCECVY